jgi:microcystin-dependent protein
MANVIKPKRSYTATNTPTLAAGELGLNATDGKIWIGNAAGNANVLVSSLTRSDHTGTLGVANGGTSLTTLTANNVILGNGTSAPTFVAPSTSGNLLTSNGTIWASTAPAAQMPTGALTAYAGATAPTGYLLCDGSSVSSTTYLALHAVISNTYGGTAYTGAGALSFNLPDLRGRLPMGAGTGTGLNSSGTGAPSGTAQTARTRGAWLGEETHLLTAAELASHTHANTVGSSAGGSNQITGAMSANENHTHGPGSGQYFWVYNSGGANTVPSGSAFKISADASTATTATTNLAHTHTIGINNVANTPSGSRHDTIPPVVVLNYIIKT